jgi:hypothetical protein
MAIVVTFIDYLPPARFDSEPWTHAEVEEGATRDTTDWTLIDTITLSPVDSDPAAPMLRSFTTDQGTDGELWYRVVWTDGNGNSSSPTLAVQNIDMVPSMYATAEELAGLLRVKVEDRREELNRVLQAAAFEINEEVNDGQPFASPPAIVSEVNIERAVEHWHQQQAPFGVIGLGGVETGSTHTAVDSWRRHAEKLSFLKETWGIA